MRECWDCKECFPLCPTSALQAAYVLTEALLEPSTSATQADPGQDCASCQDCGS